MLYVDDYVTDLHVSLYLMIPKILMRGIINTPISVDVVFEAKRGKSGD